MFWFFCTIFCDLLPTVLICYTGIIDTSSVNTAITTDSCASMFLGILITASFTVIICRYGKTVFGKRQKLILCSECFEYCVGHILWTASIAVLVVQTAQTRSVCTLVGQCLLFPIIQGLIHSQFVETNNLCEEMTSEQNQRMRLISVSVLLTSMLLSTCRIISNIWHECMFHHMSIISVISITLTATVNFLVITYDVDKHVHRYICRTRSWCVAIISMCSSVYIDLYIVRSVESIFVYFTVMAFGPSMYMIFTQTKLSMTSKDNEISTTPIYCFVFGAIVMVCVIGMNSILSASSFSLNSSISRYNLALIGFLALIADINQNIVTYQRFPILNGNYKQIPQYGDNVTRYLTMCVFFVITMSFQKWIVNSLTVKQPVFTVIMHLVRLISQIFVDCYITKIKKPAEIDERTSLLDESV
jgi:hypothetical protein